MPDVKSDPALDPQERETTFRMAADEDVVHVHSEQRAVISSMLEHPAFSEDSRRWHRGAIVAVTGTIPINYLTVKGTARNGQNNPSEVVPQQYESDTDA